MSFQECMPAQQISPSAASRWPLSFAIVAASRKVSAIFTVLALGFSRHFATPNSAESMRITPYFRTPCRSNTFAIRQAIFTAERNFSRAAASPIAGRNPHEWLAAFAADPAVSAVFYCGEIGGDKEYALAAAIPACDKPVVAMLVGRHAPPGRRMGHAGALAGAERETAAAKLAALAAAGARVARDPDEAIAILKELSR